MLTNRVFFVACAAASALILILTAAVGLPEQAAPEPISAGYRLWQANQCGACHTLYGLGGAYGPDLTQIHAQRGDTYIREFLQNPSAFHPGDRIMPRLHLTQSEMDALLAFLASTSGSPVTAAFPPRPIVVRGGAVAAVEAQTVETGDSLAEQGRALFSRAPALCSTCHSLEPETIIVGPSLYGIADRAWYRIPGVGPEDYIRNSILYPDEYIVEGFADVMQKNFGETLSVDDINALIAFLMTLEEAPDGN